jgi:heat shock protein HslJ
MGGRDVPASVEITLAFPEAGRVTGKAACNRYFGTYTQARQSIGFAQMGATRMACAGLAAELETTYLKALQTASRFEIRGSEMVLHLGGPQPPLRLQRTR